MRLETLGTTISTRPAVVPVQMETGDNDEEENRDDVLTKELDALDEYVNKKNEGALTLSTIGPQSYSARVTAHVYWDGETRTKWFLGRS
jgi:hypothetical protein